MVLNEAPDAFGDWLAREVASFLDFFGDLPRDIVGPMPKHVEGDHPNRRIGDSHPAAMASGVRVW
jgi:hypothetical protein